MLDPLIIEELELLEKVKAGLAARDGTRSSSEAPILRELERLRAVMLSGEEGKDTSSLAEQWHQQSSLLRQLRGGRAAPVDPGSPYFGHLRLREGDREWDICLGRATCIERGLRIVDWRDAPISRLFYSYRQGEEYDEEIAGRERAGTVLVRRMVRIRNGDLERIQAPEGDFVVGAAADGGWAHEVREAPRLEGGEASALRVYADGQGADRRLGSDHQGAARPVDRRLPEITGLIDPEQFQLISRPSAGVLVVRGAAGSGKTTVALHRVAYLAFEDDAIDGPDTLVAVFSEALRKYVGTVLPSLGLSHVAVVTYRSWARDIRRRHYPRLPTAEREDTPALVQRLKLHPLLAAALEAKAASGDREAGSGWELPYDDWASVLTTPSLLAEARDRVAPGSVSDADIERFTSWHRTRVDEVHGFLAGDRSNDAALDAEDDALLLRAWQLRLGPLRAPGKRTLRYRHVVLDEVQDFSPLEVQVLLGCIDETAGMTLAGDTQQHVAEHGGFTSWSEFLSELGVVGHEIETLKINYRSSAEITRFAFRVLGPLREDDELPRSTREGPPVELFRFADRGACVFFLAEALRELARTEPMATVAILTPSAALSGLYYEALARSDLPRLRLVSEQDFTFKAGVEVTEVEQAKGLEFDYVVLVEADAEHYPDQPSARRRLHVGATRAIHQLWVASVGTPSRLLDEVDIQRHEPIGG